MALSVKNYARAGAAAVDPSLCPSYFPALGIVPLAGKLSCQRWNTTTQRAAERAQFSWPILRDSGTINPVFASNSAAAAP